MEKARGFQKNIYFFFTDYPKAFDCVDHNKLWKILKEMGLPKHLTCLLRNLDMDQEATVRIRHEQLTANWERSMSRLYIVTLLIYLICRVHHEKLWAGRSTRGIKISGEISKISDMQMTPPLWQKVKRS